MKKFLASLTFLAFLFISQMQLVHAFDMSGMEMSSHHYSQIEMKQSIFCKTSDGNSQSECIKELIPDKALFEQDYNKNVKTPSFSLPFSYFIEKLSQENKSVIIPI